MDPEVRLTTDLNAMREKHQVVPQGARVYVARLDPAIVRFEEGVITRRFPNDDFPELGTEIKGYVFVEATRKTVKKRFRQHLGGHPDGWPIHRFPHSKFFKPCVESLTQRYGFTNLDPETCKNVEAWLSFALYKAGYWVWGPSSQLEGQQATDRVLLGTGDFI